MRRTLLLLALGLLVGGPCRDTWGAKPALEKISAARPVAVAANPAKVVGSVEAAISAEGPAAASLPNPGKSAGAAELAISAESPTVAPRINPAKRVGAAEAPRPR